MVFAQRNNQQGADAGRDVCMPYGMVELRQIGDVDEGSAIDQFLEERVVRAAGRLPQPARQRFAITALHQRAPRLAFKDPQRPESSSAKLMRLFQYRVEHRGEITGRRIDDLQYLGGGGLLLQRLAPLGQEPRILA